MLGVLIHSTNIHSSQVLFVVQEYTVMIVFSMKLEPTLHRIFNNTNAGLLFYTNVYSHYSLKENKTEGQNE